MKRLHWKRWTVLLIFILFAGVALAETTEYSEEYIMQYYSGTETHLSVPADIDGTPVTVIGENCFLENETVQSVILPESVNIVRAYAFSQSSLQTIVFGRDEMRRIEDGAFSGSKLQSVNLPRLDRMGWGLFDGCAELCSVQLDESTGQIPPYTFRACTDLLSVTLPDSVKEIGVCGFYGCSNLSELEWPKHLERVGIDAFAGCAFREIILPGEVELIFYGAFSDCENLTYVELPRSLKYIAPTAFSGCGNVTLGVYAGSVGYDFAVNAGLSYVILPE